MSGSFYINYNNATDYFIINPANGVNVQANLSITGSTNAASVTVTSFNVGNANLTTVITGGFNVNAYNIGVISSGTLAPAALNGNYQYMTANGAWTLATPPSDCAIDILVTNGTGAGTITASGYTYASGNAGDPYVTTSGSKFIFSIRRINGISTNVVKALQ